MAKTKTTQATEQAVAPFQQEARAYPLKEPKGSVIAHASISIAEGVGAQHIDIVNGRNGVFVSMPSRKGGDGKYYDTVYTYTADARKRLHTMVLDAYIKAAEKDYPDLAAAAKKARDELGKESLTKRIKVAAKEGKNSPAPEKDKAAPAKEEAL